MKRKNIHIRGIWEGEHKEKHTETIFKAIIADNSLILKGEMSMQIHEALKFLISWTWIMLKGENNVIKLQKKGQTQREN